MFIADIDPDIVARGDIPGKAVTCRGDGCPVYQHAVAKGECELRLSQCRAALRFVYAAQIRKLNNGLWAIRHIHVIIEPVQAYRLCYAVWQLPHKLLILKNLYAKVGGRSQPHPMLNAI